MTASAAPAPTAIPALAGSEAIRFERLAEPNAHPLRVLFVTNMWPDEERPYYGSFIASQARSLVDQGVGIDVLYVRGYLGLSAYGEALRAFRRQAGLGDYDVVHVHYGHTLAAAVAIRDRPLIVSYCGGDLLGEPEGDGITRKSRLEVAVFRQLGRLADATITKSEAMAQVLPAAVRRKNHVLANGVHLDRFAPLDQATAREQLGWPQDRPTALFLGNPDDPRKNVALAREAVARAKSSVPELVLHEAWGVEPHEVPVYMSAADLLVFPSLSEGSPNAVKEAMGCSLPIVATPVGDVADRIQGVPGGFVREPEPEAFREAILEALALGGRAPALRTAVESLAIDKVARNLIGIYGDAIARRAG